MRNRVIALVLLVGLQGIAGKALPDQSSVQSMSFPVQRGDSLSITDDFGKILIRPSEGTALDIKARKSAPDPVRRDSISVTAKKEGNTVSVRSALSGAQSEAVDFEIAAPSFINIEIAGTNPEVDIAGIRGTVHVLDSAGRITVEDLASSVSLSTENADITYKSRVQPNGDVRLETTSGNIHCELTTDINLRGLIRAGGKFFWDTDPAVKDTVLQRQLGTAGPLFYAASLKGDVIVRLIPAARLGATATSDQVTSQRAEAVRDAGHVALPAQAAEARPVLSRSPSRSQPAESQAAAPATARDARGEAPAKEAQSPAVVQGGYALKVDVDSVFLNVSVRERTTNRSIAGLRKEDFRVYEDRVEQRVDQFLPTEAPFNLLLLLDTSGSTASYLHLMKQAATDFTKQINTEDRVAVAAFNSHVELLEGFTNDRTKAEKAIQRIKSSGGTAFYDALMTCLDKYMRGVEGRSAIVVFTDGVDNQLEGRYGPGSRTTFDELYRRVQESDTIIYTIFLDTEGQVPAMTRGSSRHPGGGWPGQRGGRFPGSSPFPFPFPLPTPSPGPNPSPSPSPSPYPRQRPDERAIYEEARDQLLQIAEQTGGRMYSPRRIEELSGVYSEIADDLRIQYQLGYNSTNPVHDGKWREIRVQVANHPDAVVRTRKGYYVRDDTVHATQ